MFEIFRPSVNANHIMTSSSAAILYPTLKGLESSNSSFVQVSQPIKDVNRNLTSNHRNNTSKAEKGYKFKQSQSHEFAERNDDFLINRRQQKEYSSKVPIVSNKEVGNHSSSTETVNHYVKKSDADFKTRLKIEKSQQYDIEETRIRSTDHSSKENEVFTRGYYPQA